MKKILFTILTFVFAGLGAGALTRGNDEIRLLDPINGEIIAGNLSVSWYVRDQNQTQFKSVIDVFEQACPNNGEYYGTITDNIITNLPVGGANQVFTFSTYSALKNKPSLSDGPYCLRVCGNYLENNNYRYSMCETVSITIANYNKAPIIVSKPTKTNFKTGESFSYQINATDPDQNILTYKIISAPDFIIINNQNGLMTSNGKLNQKGAYVIKYRVEDAKGAYAEDVFTINVTEDVVIENSVVLIKPNKNDNFKDQSKLNIEWKVNNNKKIKQVVISYSQDITTWTKITTINNDVKEYGWEILNQESGNYYLKLDFEFEDNSKFSLNSDSFSIDKSSGSVPFLRIISPEEDQVITDNNIVKVVLEARGANAAKIGQIKFEIDDTDYTERCQMQTDNTDTIVCSSPELDNGKHKINFLIKDFNDKQNQIEWYFEIDYQVEVSPTPVNTDNTPTNMINLENLDWQSILTYVCGGGGIIALIAIVIVLIRRLFGRRENTEVQAVVYPDANGNVTTYDIIGSQTLEDTPPVVVPTYDANNFSVPVYQPPAETNAAPQPLFSDTFNNNTEMPTSYQTNDIPDWLKDVDASKPVGIEGKDMNNVQTVSNRRDDAMDDAARPHE